MHRIHRAIRGRWTAALVLACALSLGCNENILEQLDPDIFVSPEEVDFGTVTVGVSSTQVLAIHNVGGGSLHVDSVVMDDPAGPFAVQDFGGSLGSDEVVEVEVTFLPTELGPAEGLILVTSDDPDEAVVEVPVFAVDVLEAPTPAIAWSPSSLDWGLVPSGGAVTLSVTVSSVGTADLELSDIHLDGNTSADFTLAVDPAPVTLPPSHATQVDVVYAPSDEVPDSGTLVILNNDPDTPVVEIPLSGELQPAPDIELVPSQLVFGEVTIGVTVTMEAEIWSLGDVDLELGTLIPTGSSEFTMETDPSNQILAVGESATVRVSYTPVDMNPDTGAIEIPSNDPDEPVVTLTLAGQHEPIPDIEVDPLHIDFGLVGVGVTATETVAVSNVGTGDLTVDAPILTGSTDFGLSAAQFPAVIAPGSTELILVSYLPTDLVDDSGEIAITSDDADEPLVIVTLVGAPEPAPDIDVFPTTLSYGQVMIGASSSLSATISNVGTADLDLDSVAVVNAPEFTITVDPSYQTLVPGASTTLEVTYTPVNPGTDTGLVEIWSNDPDENPVFVTLDGSELPVPDIVVDPLIIDFGQVDIGHFNTHSVFVDNIGDANLDVTAVTLSGSSDFSFAAASLPGTLLPFGGTEVYVTYTPSDDVDDTATLTFASNDPDEPTVDVALYGEATPYPDIAVDPTTLDFGGVRMNDTGYEWVTISNVGDADLEIYNCQTSGDPAFAVATNPNGSVVSPGSSVQMEIAFNPHNVGSFQGLGEIPSNDPDEWLVYVDLLGEGTAPAIELDPTWHYFAGSYVGCEYEVDIAVRSVGSAPLELQGYSFYENPHVGVMSIDATDLETYINNGWDLDPGQEVVVTVSFLPDDVLTYEGMLEVDSDDPSNPHATADQEGLGVAGGYTTDNFQQQGNNWADVLWVVDNSCSMGDEQGKLGDDFSYFYSIINNAGVDYHIANVTTDDEDFQGGTTVIYPTTPNGAQVFASNCAVGTNGSGTERGLKYGYDGLVKAMNNQSPNQNFWRDDAGLRVVFVSDENDDSGDWNPYLSGYQAMKANPDHVILSAICGTNGYAAVSCNGLGGGADPGDGYVEVVNATGGVLGSICDGSWSTTLTNLAWITVNLADTFTLSYQAIPNTIDVTINGVAIYSGYSYDAALNAIVFDPAYVPDDGDIVSITYGYYGNC